MCQEPVPKKEATGPLRYRLKCYMRHSGDASQGHYTAQVCDYWDRSWSTYNDSTVTPVCATIHFPFLSNFCLMERKASDYFLFVCLFFAFSRESVHLRPEPAAVTIFFSFA